MTTPLEFELVRSILAKVADSELVTKGPDYAHHNTETGEIDRMANFKEVVRRLDGAPLDLTTVCMVYLEKHAIAIERAVKDRALSSEGLLGRLADLRNYLDLLLACFAESNPDMVPQLVGGLAERVDSAFPAFAGGLPSMAGSDGPPPKRPFVGKREGIMEVPTS